jgi:hypothetical protein
MWLSPPFGYYVDSAAIVPENLKDSARDKRGTQHSFPVDATTRISGGLGAFELSNHRSVFRRGCLKKAARSDVAACAISPGGQACRNGFQRRSYNRLIPGEADAHRMVCRNHNFFALAV